MEGSVENKYTDPNAALRASSDVLKYSFSFLAFVLFGTVIAGECRSACVALSDGCDHYFVLCWYRGLPLEPLLVLSLDIENLLCLSH